MINEIIGPKLTDARFFGELIDCSIPGLEEIPKAAAVGDYAKCRKVLAAYVRATLEPDKFFTLPYERSENLFTFKGETEEEAAERISKLHLISCGTPYQFKEKVDWFHNPTYNQYKEWTWQLNRCHEWKVLAYQYRMTGDEKYAKVFVQMFDSWVKQAIAPEDDVKGGETICWRTIECGIRMNSNWPYVLFAFINSPYITDDILTDWYKSVWEHGHRLRMNHRNGNWLIMEMYGLVKIGVLYPLYKQSGEWFDYAMRMLQQELERQVYPEPDCFQVELTTAYHNAVISEYMGLIRFAKVYEISLPEMFLSRMEKMLEVYVKLMRPDGLLPDINDGMDMSVGSIIANHKELFPQNRYFQWVCDESKADEYKPEFTSVAMEYAGMMIMRNGWGEQDTWGFLDVAPFGTGHQHEDKLNLMIHAKGKNILTECGNYAYDGSEMRKYAISSRSHNTVRVNGMDQYRRGSYHWNEEDINKKANMEYRIEDAFDYVTGVYDEGYGNCDADTAFKDKEINDIVEGSIYNGAKHRRTVLFMKKPEANLEPYYIVIDRLYSEDRNEYEFLWHVDAEKVSVSGIHVKADFLHILNNLTDVKTDGVSIVNGQQIPEWQGWKKGASGIQGDDLHLPTVRYTTIAETTRVVTLLYPGEECPIAAVDADHKVESTLFTLVMENGERMELDEAVFAPK